MNINTNTQSTQLAHHIPQPLFRPVLLCACISLALAGTSALAANGQPGIGGSDPIIVAPPTSGMTGTAGSIIFGGNGGISGSGSLGGLGAEITGGANQ